MTAAPSLNSSHPAERQEAARLALAEARIALDQATRAWEERANGLDRDELRMLRETVQGCKTDVGNWIRHIKQGCPKGR